MPTITEQDFWFMVGVSKEAHPMDHQERVLYLGVALAHLGRQDCWRCGKVELWDSGRMSFQGTNTFYTASQAAQMIEDMRQAKVIDW